MMSFFKRNQLIVDECFHSRKQLLEGFGCKDLLHGYIVVPPSAKKIPPVQYDDESEARNSASAAISSTVPILPIGTAFINFFSIFSSCHRACENFVLMSPG